jgi:hypothetical protein
MMEPTMSVLYVVKCTVETVGVCAYCWHSHDQNSQRHYVSCKALLSVVLFSHHVNLFLGCKFTDMAHLLKTVTLQAHAQRHQHITGIVASFDYIRVADTIDSQMLEDWHHWQITVNVASDNQRAVNTVTNTLFSHRSNLVWLIARMRYYEGHPESKDRLRIALAQVNTPCQFKVARPQSSVGFVPSKFSTECII